MLKTAQVGLGWWGSQVTKVLKGSEKIEIVCGVDPSADVAQRYRDAHGLPVLADFRQVLDDPAVEAVILTIPHRLHEDAVLRAAAAGKQIVSMARALSHDARLIVMDEPSEGLAPTIIEVLIETFQLLEQEGLAILLIEQNLGVATALAERQLVMIGGRIAAETTASALIRLDPAAAEELSEHVEARRQETGIAADHLVLKYDGAPLTPEYILRALAGHA